MKIKSYVWNDQIIQQKQRKKMQLYKITNESSIIRDWAEV